MSKTLLFGALDWGLGHATRSIPLLTYFSEKGWTLVIAANAGPQKILQEAFPEATFVEPPAYNIHYSQQPSFFTLGLLHQLPKITRVMSAEKQWIAKYTQQHPIDLILSDNRYGFYHPTIPSYVITHQLSPISGWGKMIDGIARKLHDRLLKPFHQILVPDLPVAPGIAGRLAHPPSLPPRTHFIGLLSRFAHMNVPTREVPSIDILVVLSGPEPSRTIFEEKIRKQLQDFQGRYLLVQGLPKNHTTSEKNILPYADPQTLKQLIQSAAFVICRSGYSSVMDLLAIGKKALLIPTPGQTEQLYLADHLERMGLFPTMKEKEFDLKEAIRKVNAFEPKMIEKSFDHFKKVLDQLIDESKNKSTSIRTHC